MAKEDTEAVLAPAGAAQHLPADPRQRQGAALQRAELVVVAAVEELRRGVDAPAERLVVGVPPEVAGQRRLPRDLLDVDTLVEAELRVRAAEARVLHAAPRALHGAVRVHVIVDPDHPGLDAAR